MDEDSKQFKIPFWAKAPGFDASQKTSEVYDELNAISEEIEKCRLENSQDY